MAYDKKRTNELLQRGSQLSMADIDELIRLNIGLVGAQLKAFSLENDHDAISLAYEGLHKAILNYDINNSANFSTYATVCIKNSIRQSLRNSKESVVLVSLDCILELDIEHKYNDAFVAVDNAGAITLDTISRIIDELISTESPSSKRVLQCWIASDYQAINKVIADKLNVSQPYVNGIINKFRQRLAKKLGEA